MSTRCGRQESALCFWRTWRARPSDLSALPSKRLLLAIGSLCSAAICHWSSSAGNTSSPMRRSRPPLISFPEVYERAASAGEDGNTAPPQWSVRGLRPRPQEPSSEEAAPPPAVSPFRPLCGHSQNRPSQGVPNRCGQASSPRGPRHTPALLEETGEWVTGLKSRHGDQHCGSTCTLRRSSARTLTPFVSFLGASRVHCRAPTAANTYLTTRQSTHQHRPWSTQRQPLHMSVTSTTTSMRSQKSPLFLRGALCLLLRAHREDSQWGQYRPLFGLRQHHSKSRTDAVLLLGPQGHQLLHDSGGSTESLEVELYLIAD